MAEVWVTIKAVKMERKGRPRDIWEVGSTEEAADDLSWPGNKVPQIGWFKRQKFIISQFWRLEVWNPGGGRPGLVPSEAVRKESVPGLSPWLVRAVLTFTWLSPWMNVCLSPNVPFL